MKVSCINYRSFTSILYVFTRWHYLWKTNNLLFDVDQSDLSQKGYDAKGAWVRYLSKIIITYFYSKLQKLQICRELYILWTCSWNSALIHILCCLVRQTGAFPVHGVFLHFAMVFTKMIITSIKFYCTTFFLYFAWTLPLFLIKFFSTCYLLLSTAIEYKR